MNINRKKFIKTALLTGVFGAVAPQLLKAKNSKPNKSIYDTLMQQLEFNHLPTNMAGLTTKTVKL